MAFRILPVKRKSGPQFKILFEWFEQGDRKYKGIPKAEWARHGFRLDMSIEEAKLRRDSLNAQERLAKTEVRRQKILERFGKERDEQKAFFPEHYRKEFETHKLPDSKKGRSYWNTAARIVTAVALPPDQWVDSAERFYREFLRRQMSPAYINNVLPLINKWGSFYSRKLGKPFDKIPTPPRSWAVSIAEAHYSRDSRRGCRESDPLTPEMLSAKKDKFGEAEYRWLSFSVWFGLRPVEIDQFSKSSSKKTWWVEAAANGRPPVLWVYQTKLKGLKPEKRTKGIPAILPEQQALLVNMELPVSRPARRDMIESFGKEVTLYGGRKNFEALMKAKGQKFENVSAWLGHSDINRTYRNYFNRQEVKYDPAA